MLHKRNPLQYPDFIDLAKTHDCGSVYPLSVAEGIQGGDIFTKAAIGGEAFLVWTHCGFAYLLGKADKGFLEELYGMMPDGAKPNAKRLLLMTRDQSIKLFFEQKSDVVVEKRYLFAYDGKQQAAESCLSAGCEMKEIDGRLLEKISGQIVPSRFWRNADDFLERGKGYCIVCGNDIASWAFSAAVSTEEIDIGIETNAKYRQQGLGSIAASKMIAYTIGQTKRPVWACHSNNTASRIMAEKLGFIRTGECFVIKKGG